MPLTAAEVQTQLAEEVQNNPDQNQAPTVVHVTLKFDGVTFDASDLYAALDTIYPVIKSDRDHVGRGNYHFTITAT